LNPREIPGLEPRLNNNVHFQYAFSARAKDVAATFADHGIGVRVIGVAHGVSPDAPRTAHRAPTNASTLPPRWPR
jgi:hypothetical protein